MAQQTKLSPMSNAKWVGLVSGPAAAIVLYLVMPDGYQAVTGTEVTLGAAAKATAAIGLWMAIWWITEAIPVYATALVPLALFPLAGARAIRETAEVEQIVQQRVLGVSSGDLRCLALQSRDESLA